MQSLTGTSLATAPGSGRAAICEVTVGWDGTNFVDESAYVMEASGELNAHNTDAGLAAVGNCIANTARVTLLNQTRRFTPWNAGGALYAHIADGAWQGKPIRIKVGYKNALGVAEGVYVMKGHIDNLRPSVPDNTVEIEVINKSLYWIDYKVRTPMYRNKRTDELVTVLHTLVGKGTLTKDIGLFSIPFFWGNGESAEELLSMIAEAEGGRAYYTPAGGVAVTSALVFENGGHLLGHSASVDTLAVDDWERFAAHCRARDRKNHVSVTYTPLRIGHAMVLWKSPEIQRVPAGKTVNVNAAFRYPAAAVTTPAAAIDYVAVTAGGANRTTDLTLTVADTFGQQADLTLENTGTADLYLVRLQLRGIPVVGGDQEKAECWIDDAGAYVADPTTTTPDGGWRTHEVKANPLVQTREHAQALARSTAQRLYLARMSVSLTGVDGRPWLEPGDRVTVTEVGGELNTAFFVMGHAWHYGNAGLTSDLDLLPAAGLYAHDDYFILGTHTLGAASAAPGRYFW